MNSRENRIRKAALMVMLSDDEKEKIKLNANAQGMTMSSYARWMLLAGEKKEATQNGEL